MSSIRFRTVNDSIGDSGTGRHRESFGFRPNSQGRFMVINSVNVDKRENSFVVRIIESGSVSEKRFGNEDFANSWATGQRMRLGLPYDNTPSSTVR